MRKIEVVPYQTEWQMLYQKEEAMIAALLKETLIRSFHIGSTAVPNLKAKPIIDILLVVSDLEALDTFSDAFEALGYEARGEFGIEGRRYFIKGGDQRTHHIHAFRMDNFTEIERHLVFKEYLCAHPIACQEYEDLKSRLAVEFPNDNEGYCDGKDAFIKKMETVAMEWYWKNR